MVHGDLLKWNVKSFGTVLKIWQKNNCGRAGILETLQAEIIFQRFLCILKILIVKKSFAGTFRNMDFLCDAIDLKQLVEGTLKVLGKSF